MIATSLTNWYDVNQSYLDRALERVQLAVQHQVSQLQGESFAPTDAPDLTWNKNGPAPALVVLQDAFALTPFERDLLVLCAGVELNATLAQRCAMIQRNPQLTYPTFNLALTTLADPHWSALTPTRPLRRWRLIDVNPGEGLVHGRLRIDERVLHYLKGVVYLDDRLRGMVEPLPGSPILPPSHQQLVVQIGSLWERAALGQMPVVQLCGDDLDEKGAIALAVCQSLGLTLHTLQSTNLPGTPGEREAFARLWERESILSSSALLVEYDDLEGSDRLATLRSFLETLPNPLLLSGREPLTLRQRSSLRLDVKKPTSVEQRKLWETLLPSSLAATELEVLTGQFNLGATTIHRLATEANLNESFNESVGHGDRPSSLWLLCRTQSRTRLDDLAQRIEAIAQWDDLILPDDQQQTLRELAAQVRHRTTVYDTWEFARRGANGLGISALFAGASGTGKTMAAEVLASELELDLYRIDLSQVVSKYIGETEKNLRRVFDAAEAGGAILLFDEADALFGKRSDIKDSHDRYANIEVSYLLQRMEAYRGLAILTSNFRSAIDTAFLRRIRFVIQFPFPDALQRRTIWQRMFPPKLPTAGLDFDNLARLNVTGGNIRNIALNAAFLAADAQEPVQMKHLLRAAQSEYSKLEKTLTETEVGGWI